jgi:hypothetical protein
MSLSNCPVESVNGAFLCLLPLPHIEIVFVTQSMSPAFTFVTSLNLIPESANSAMIALWVGLFAWLNNSLTSILLRLGNILLRTFGGSTFIIGFSFIIPFLTIQLHNTLNVLKYECFPFLPSNPLRNSLIPFADNSIPIALLKQE